MTGRVVLRRSVLENMGIPANVHVISAEMESDMHTVGIATRKMC